MKFTEYHEKAEQVVKLAKFGNTGTPKELAERLKISERTLYRLIQCVNERGTAIEFCRKSKSYLLKK